MESYLRYEIWFWGWSTNVQDLFLARKRVLRIEAEINIQNLAIIFLWLSYVVYIFWSKRISKIKKKNKEIAIFFVCKSKWSPINHQMLQVNDVFLICCYWFPFFVVIENIYFLNVFTIIVTYSLTSFSVGFYHLFYVFLCYLFYLLLLLTYTIQFF